MTIKIEWLMGVVVDNCGVIRHKNFFFTPIFNPIRFLNNKDFYAFVLKITTLSCILILYLNFAIWRFASYDGNSDVFNNKIKNF